MAWRKLGLVFAGPDGRHPALRSHAALPVPFSLGGDLVRIFYSGRDGANRSSVGSVVLRLGESPRVEEDRGEPILVPGGIGAFDDAGIGIGCIVPGEESDRLYYMGWNVGGSVPWRNAIGVAFGSAREARFERDFVGPLLDRSPEDPFSLSYPWVLRTGPSDWRMWYGTHLRWGATQADMNHAIRFAHSIDGLAWQRAPEICLAAEAQEIATVRPSVVREANGGYAMCFASRGLDSPYRVGRAVSPDGCVWRRVPAEISATEEWEAGALTYPAVFDQAGRRWLLFNGHGYGATGFGLAVWEAG